VVKLREPVRIVVNDERQAGAVTRELVGLVGLDVHPAEGRWEVTLNCIKTDRLVIRVLDAVRSSLARDPSASALVVLEGREYHIQGTPSATAASEPERGDPPETQLAASGRPRS
jgi:hypothetical protein